MTDPENQTGEDDLVADKKTRDSVRAAVSAYSDVSASSEQTANIEPGDPPLPVTSQRRLVPPDSKPQNWWRRHHSLLVLAEWAIIAVFFILAMYYLYLLVFAPRLVAWKVEAEPGRWRYIVLHHSATSGGTPEAFDRYHREKRGWENGLGYHFVIGNGSGMADGEIAAGRRWLEQLNGAHVTMAAEERANACSIGIVLVGDFEKSPPTEAQLQSLDLLLAFLVDEYGIEEDRIVGHGHVAKNHTECPGKLFPLPMVMRTLAARNGGGTGGAGSGG